jgi:ketosteroid isomerase-like protein
MPASPRETVDRFLRAATSANPGDMADCYAEHVVVEMPFAPAGLIPARAETTREEMRARFQAGRAVRTYERLEDVRIHETADPEVIVIEYTLHGRMVEADRPFALTFVMVMTIRDGLIAHTRDYTDPIEGAKALGMLPALLSSLGA